ncbi:MAG: hypothetical protein GX129_01995 [Clostridiales bacterium]|jgi:CDP-diglyceride synthetase|nr:hypothetical protein [Clostridiales bacterium]
MNKRTLITIGKWFLLAILASGNFMAYMINETRINIILVIVILVYGTYEFFNSLSGKNLNLNFKLYLFFFYMLSNISLILGLRALMSDQFQMVIMCLLFLIGDIILILYMLHKSTTKE